MKRQTMTATDDEPKGQTAGDGEQNQKHDEGYKSILSDIANFLHFLKKYIAEPWTKNIVASDLVKVDNSYVTSEYSNIDADLIYKLKTGGADVYFYVLVFSKIQKLQKRVARRQ